MSDASPPTASWKLRLWAWWEGYDLIPLLRRKGRGGEDGDENGGGERGELDRTNRPLWTATRIQVAEKIWGEGFCSPGGKDYIPELVKPLGLSPARSVLDLSAGLGGAARLMATEYGCWVTGLEASPVLAAAAMERSVKANLVKQAPILHYDPDAISLQKRVDCIFAKESFYTIKNKEKLWDAVTAAIKPKGMLLVTDYILDQPGGPAVQAWFAEEPVEPFPMSLKKYVEALQGRNLDVRITEDITERQIAMITVAIQGLTDHLGRHSLDNATRQAVLDEVELWGRRVAALQDGLKLYRIFALKMNDDG